MSIKLGQREVGDGSPCFITLEAGPTHDGLDTARKLVRLAAEAGADAVKFQVLDPDRLVADRNQMFSYEILVDRESGRTETVSEPLYDILCRRTLSEPDWKILKEFSDSLGLAFFATAMFDDDIKLLERLGCDSIKIASGDVNHFPLIRMAARTGMCLQLDTGNATLGEIESAVDVIRSEGNDRIIIHQCPSGYPARFESINLRIIPTLKRMFGYPAAYSDHTPGWDMDIAAIALGANLVEKTISLDRMTRSIEHVMSLEPSEMRKFVQTVRNLETALGSARRIMTEEELEKRLAVRRSIFLAEPVRAGQTIRNCRVEFRRPGYGIGPDRLSEFQDAEFKSDLPTGHMLQISDFI
ncbi:MAG: N-acetylneuraminate synthase family protein [Gammaproteobacteria bacterium]|nr:N-acetylneuraminate synthase family protein [Gammaproteobacteria bacterium]